MDNIAERRKKRFWNQILKVISRGNVVPVVGEDLLLVGTDPEVYFYDELAVRFAAYSGIEPCLDQPCKLSSTVRNHPDFNNNRHDISQEIGEEFEDWNPPIPEPLRALARITDFNLFVSTTFDDLLEKALNEERFDGAERTQVIAYSPKQVPSDTEIRRALDSGAPVIFQVFGNYRSPLNFALTEGDKLEYMHHLHSHEHSPSYLLSELHERPIMLIGNKFPDWLARTFLRLTRRVRLDDNEVPKQYLSDSEIKDPALKFFLDRFTKNTDVIDDQSPAEFAISLAQRWRENHDEAPQQTATSEIKNYQALRNPPPPDAIFISYAATTEDNLESPDRAMAIKIRNALEDAGINAWLDIDDLHIGDDYARKIRKYISNCGLFMPIISQNTNSREESFFRREWAWALDRLDNFTGSKRRFIVPVAMDGIDPNACEIPEEFMRFHFFQLDEGPTERFVAAIKELCKSQHLQQTG